MPRLPSVSLPFAPLLLTTAAAAQTALAWTPVAATQAPAWRRFEGTASDSLRQRLVLYGGQNAQGAPLADTWEWTGNDWLQRQSAASPPPRHGHALAYDPLRQRVVLFGGVIDEAASIYRDDLWEWDGSNWAPRFPAARPAPRRQPGLVWDGASQRVLCFGGRVGMQAYANDTWLWDGSQWQQQLPAVQPPGRDGHALVHDPARQRVVMFGGFVLTGPSNDTWEWDGSQWLPRNPLVRPSPRLGHGLAHDPVRGRTVLAGGTGPTGALLADTWEYDGVVWQQVAGNTMAPPFSGPTQLAFDHASARVTTCLRSSPLGQGAGPNDTWQLIAAPVASAVPYGSGCAGSNGVPQITAGSRPAVGTTFRIDGTNLPTYAPQLAIGYFGFSRQSWGPFLLPLELSAFGMPGCRMHASPPEPGEILSTWTHGGTCTWFYPVPWHPLFLGITVYFQALIPDAQAGNPLGGTVTNALQVTIGL